MFLEKKKNTLTVCREIEGIIVMETGFFFPRGTPYSAWTPCWVCVYQRASVDLERPSQSTPQWVSFKHGFHDLYQFRHVPKLYPSACCCLVAQTCLTLCDPMDGSPPGSSVHGILQARILRWVAMPSSRGIFPT